MMPALVVAGYGCCLTLLAVAIDQAPEALNRLDDWWHDRRQP